MQWEIQRQKLSELGDRFDYPLELSRLANASTVKEAEYTYWKFDNIFIVQGTLYPNADKVASCMVNALFNATKFGQEYILEFLIQVGVGGAGPEHLEGGVDRIALRCRDAILSGIEIYFMLLENSADESFATARTGIDAIGFSCVDLLYICTLHDNKHNQRVVWYLEFLKSKPFINDSDKSYLCGLISSISGDTSTDRAAGVQSSSPASQ